MTSQVVTSCDFKKAQIRPPKPHFRAKHKIETHFYFQFGKRMSLRQVDFRKIEKMTCPNGTWTLTKCSDKIFFYLFIYLYLLIFD